MKQCIFELNEDSMRNIYGGKEKKIYYIDEEGNVKVKVIIV